MKYFYSSLIEIEPLLLEIESLNLTQSQKSELAGLVDQMIHQSIMDTVLTGLDESDKFLFVEHLKKQSPVYEVMDFLKSKMDNIEIMIRESFEDIKEELRKDIKEADNLSQKY